jgi:glucose/mannose transport system substrate-binding protein
VSSAAREPTPLLELVTWWREPGEIDALQNLASLYMAQHPNARVFNASAGRADALQRVLTDSLEEHQPPDHAQLDIHAIRQSPSRVPEVIHNIDPAVQAVRRIEAGDPPDLLQLNISEIRSLRSLFPDALYNMDGWVDAMGLRRAAFPEALAAVTSGGHVLAVPITFHRENALIYNKTIFTAHGLSPPETVADLVTLCGKLKAAGVTPFATVHQGWILRLMFNSIAAGHMGGARFRDFFTGVDPGGGLPKVRESLAIFSALVANCANPDAGEEGFGWPNAAQAVAHGDAAMFLHGDWAKAYLTQLGWRPGIDFDAIAAPGTSDLVLYVVDTFAVPTGAKNARGARDFLATAISPEGQLAFSSIKGSIPMRPDVPRAGLDPVTRATFLEFERARIRMPSPNSTALDDAFLKLVVEKDLAGAEAALVAYARGAR